MYHFHSAPANSLAPQPLQKPPAQRPFELNRSANEHIRELLRIYELRASLIRFKVIDALWVANREGRSIGARGVHTALELSAAKLSFLSVREVLKRLRSEGVILSHPDNSYSFTAEARAVLEHCSGD